MSNSLYEKCTKCGHLLILQKQIAINHSIYLCTNSKCKHSIQPLVI